MSALLIALTATALAGDLETKVTVKDADGLDAGALQAALQGLEVGPCVADSTSYWTIDVELRSDGGDPPAVRLTQPPKHSHSPEAGPCVADALLARAREAVGTAPGAAWLTITYGAIDRELLGSLVGRTGTQIGRPNGRPAAPPAPEPLTAAQAAAGLVVTTSKAEGIDGAALSAALLAQRERFGACYTGPADGGHLSVSLDWTKKEQHARIVGTTSGMDDTGGCAIGVLGSVALREVAGAKKSGRASVKLAFQAPE